MTRHLKAALLFSTMVVLACLPATAQSTLLDLTANQWTTITGGSASVPLANDVNGGLYLDIPVMADGSCTSGCTSINYLYTQNAPSVIEGDVLLVTMTAETTGNPVFHYTGDQVSCSQNLPNVRPFIWGHNNNLADGYRWWVDDQTYQLQPNGEPVTFLIPLDPAHFRGRDGEMANQNNQTLHKWESTLNDISSIGVTFGGGCNFGHGVYVTGGTARFTLRYYEVHQPPACPTVTPCALPCQRGAETGMWPLQFPVCLNGDGSFTTCGGSQSLWVVNNTCNRPACCKPPCVACPPSCASGSYLECR